MAKNTRDKSENPATNGKTNRWYFARVAKSRYLIKSVASFCSLSDGVEKEKRREREKVERKGNTVEKMK